jgi:SagB-type dehydrogenase family enzyme
MAIAREKPPPAPSLTTNPLATVFSRRLGSATQFVAELPASKRTFEISSDAFVCLHYASRGCSVRDLRTLQKRVLSLDRAEAVALTRELVTADLLIADERTSAIGLDTIQRRWAERSWDSAFYYYSWIRDYPFLDYSATEARTFDDNLMKTYARASAPPSVFRDYENCPLIPLERSHPLLESATVRDALIDRDAASSQRLSLRALGSLLYLVFGQTGLIQRRSFPPLLLKTSPSGGARHPIEAYAIVVDVEGLNPGLYHYSVRHHALELVRASDISSAVRGVIHGLPDPSMFTTQAVVVMTAIWQRAAWRYRDPRAYRPVLHDLGHIVQTFECVARALRLDCQQHHGFDDARLEDLLGVDGFEESALFLGVLRDRQKINVLAAGDSDA